MAELHVQILDDIEEELGFENETIQNLRKISKRLNDRFTKIADTLEILEKHGWSWTTGPKDIYLRKDTPLGQAEEELKKLKVDTKLFRFSE